VEQSALKRNIGLLGAIALITGTVVGSSIFILLPSLAGLTGPSVWIAYALGVIPAIFTILYQMQLTGTLPVTGANYVSVTRMLSPFWGGICSIAGAVAIITANVFVAVGFAKIICASVPGIPELVWSIGLVAIFAVINYFGISLSTKIQALMFVLFILGILVFGVGGLMNSDPANLTPLFPNGVLPFILVIVVASVGWIGFIALAEIGGEIKEPRRTIPRALIISLVIILFLYLLQSFALVATMPWDQAGKAGSDAIWIDAATFLSPPLVILLYVAFACAVLTTINGLTMSGARTFVAWARDGLIPQAVAKIDKRFATPGIAILLVFILELIGILVAAGIEQYALAQVLAIMVVQILGATAVLMMPKKIPELYSKGIFQFNKFWRWFIWIGCIVIFSLMFLFGIVLDMLDDKGDINKTPYTIIVLVGILMLGTVWWFIRKAYLRKKGIDLSERMRNTSGASVQEAQD